MERNDISPVLPKLFSEDSKYDINNENINPNRLHGPNKFSWCNLYQCSNLGWVQLIYTEAGPQSRIVHVDSKR